MTVDQLGAFLLILFAWPNGIVVGNLLASFIWAAPALWHLHRKLDRHHREHLAAAARTEGAPMYCPHCGAEQAAAEQAAEAAVEAGAEVEAAAAAPDVEIARIQADRDIALARIGAGVEKVVAENETAVDLAHAEGQLAGQADIIEAMTPDAPPEPEPVVVVADPASSGDDDGGTEPPDVPVAPPVAKSKANPWW